MSQSISRRGFVTGAFGAAALAMSEALRLPRHAFADDAQAEDGTIVILHTNDVHCAVGEPDKDGTIPLAYAALSSYTQDLKTHFGTDNVMLVDAGDAVQGKAIGTLTKGEAIVDIMNTCGYDHAIPGNHEFDFGMAQFDHLIGLAKAKYLSCNFTDNRTGSPQLRFAPYEIRTFGEEDGVQTKVAFVGVTTPATLTASTPRSFWRSDDDHTCVYGFCEDSTGEALYSAVQSAANSAKADGADYVILLAHLGESGSPDIWRSDTLIEHCSGIDIVIDGHSHEEYIQIVEDREGASVILTQTGTQFASVGQIIINPQTGEVRASTPGCVAALLREHKKEGDPNYINEVSFERDDDTQAVVNSQLSVVAQQTNVKVGTSDIDLYAYESDEFTWAVRSHETNLGDFVADAYLYYASNNGVYADFAFVNGGGIRKNIKAGDITAGNLIDVNPFNNQLCYTEITGQDLLDALELSVSLYPDPYGEFLQISEGLKFTARTDIPSPVKRSGTKVTGIDPNMERRVRNVTLHDSAIDLSRSYKLVCHSYYLIDGGGSYSMLQKDDVSLLDLDNVALTEYLKINLHGAINQSQYANPNGEGRITLQDGPDPQPEPSPTPEPSQKPGNGTENNSGSKTAVTTKKTVKTTSERLAKTGDDGMSAAVATIAAGATALGVAAALEACS